MMADEAWVKNGAFLIPNSLPGDFESVRQNMGDRLTAAGKAVVQLQGSLTDSGGTRSVTITVQAPGYLLLQDNTRSIAYDGIQWSVKNGRGGQDDQRAQESLLAHLPDTLLLQLANYGTVRRIGGHFRTDDGKTAKYSGPYWTIYSFTPSVRAGLTKGEALQQGYLVAIDEKTSLISEVRIVVSKAPNQGAQVIQTKFNKWFQQGGQWYPGEILRTENGQQVLKLSVQGGQVGAQVGITSFRP